MNQMKMMLSRLPGWTTFLAASCCLDAFQTSSSSAQTDIVKHGGGEAASLGNGGAVMKEAFIANLVANMTIPELGEKCSYTSSIVSTALSFKCSRYLL